MAPGGAILVMALFTVSHRMTTQLVILVSTNNDAFMRHLENGKEILHIMRSVADFLALLLLVQGIEPNPGPLPIGSVQVIDMSKNGQQCTDPEGQEMEVTTEDPSQTSECESTLEAAGSATAQTCVTLATGDFPSAPDKDLIVDLQACANHPGIQTVQILRGDTIDDKYCRSYSIENKATSQTEVEDDIAAANIRAEHAPSVPMTHNEEEDIRMLFRRGTSRGPSLDDDFSEISSSDNESADDVRNDEATVSGERNVEQNVPVIGADQTSSSPIHGVCSQAAGDDDDSVDSDWDDDIASRSMSVHKAYPGIDEDDLEAIFGCGSSRQSTQGPSMDDDFCVNSDSDAESIFDESEDETRNGMDVGISPSVMNDDTKHISRSTSSANEACSQCVDYNDDSVDSDWDDDTPNRSVCVYKSYPGFDKDDLEAIFGRSSLRQSAQGPTLDDDFCLNSAGDTESVDDETVDKVRNDKDFVSSPPVVIDDTNHIFRKEAKKKMVTFAEKDIVLYFDKNMTSLGDDDSVLYGEYHEEKASSSNEDITHDDDDSEVDRSSPSAIDAFSLYDNNADDVNKGREEDTHIPVVHIDEEDINMLFRRGSSYSMKSEQGPSMDDDFCAYSSDSESIDEVGDDEDDDVNVRAFNAVDVNNIKDLNRNIVKKKNVTFAEKDTVIYFNTYVTSLTDDDRISCDVDEHEVSTVDEDCFEKLPLDNSKDDNSVESLPCDEDPEFIGSSTQGLSRCDLFEDKLNYSCFTTAKDNATKDMYRSEDQCSPSGNDFVSSDSEDDFTAAVSLSDDEEIYDDDFMSDDNSIESLPFDGDDVAADDSQTLNRKCTEPFTQNDNHVLPAQVLCIDENIDLDDLIYDTSASQLEMPVIELLPAHLGYPAIVLNSVMESSSVNIFDNTSTSSSKEISPTTAVENRQTSPQEINGSSHNVPVTVSQTNTSQIHDIVSVDVSPEQHSTVPIELSDIEISLLTSSQNEGLGVLKKSEDLPGVKTQQMASEVDNRPDHKTQQSVSEVHTIQPLETSSSMFEKLSKINTPKANTVVETRDKDAINFAIMDLNLPNKQHDSVNMKHLHIPEEINGILVSMFYKPELSTDKYITTSDESHVESLFLSKNSAASVAKIGADVEKMNDKMTNEHNSPYSDIIPEYLSLFISKPGKTKSPKAGKSPKQSTDATFNTSLKLPSGLTDRKKNNKSRVAKTLYRMFHYNCKNV